MNRSPTLRAVGRFLWLALKPIPRLPGPLNGAIGLAGVVAGPSLALAIQREFTVGRAIVGAGLALAALFLVAGVRLQREKDDATRISIVVEDAEAQPPTSGTGVIVRLAIRNRGVEVKMNAVIEDLRGTREPFVDRGSPAYWQGRQGVHEETIPSHGPRYVAIAYVRVGAVRGELMSVQLMSPAGKPGRRQYGADGPVEFDVLLSTVDGRTDYAKVVTVRIEARDGDVHAQLVAERNP